MDFSRKIEAIELRKEGKSYSEIKNIVNVSKSTLSDWLKDIELRLDGKTELEKYF